MWFRDESFNNDGRINTDHERGLALIAPFADKLPGWREQFTASLGEHSLPLSIRHTKRGKTSLNLFRSEFSPQFLFARHISNPNVWDLFQIRW